MPGLPATRKQKLVFRVDGKLSLRRRKRTPPKHLNFLRQRSGQTPWPYRTPACRRNVSLRSSRPLVHLLVQDQRFVEKRPDCGGVGRPTFCAGRRNPYRPSDSAKLFGRNNGSDADWVVKLIERISRKASDTEWNLSSYELMIADEIFRGRYRNSYEKPEAIVPR